MQADLVALIPPLVAAAAFLAGVVLFLRRQMGPGHAVTDDESGPDIPDERLNADQVDPAAARSVHDRKS